MASPVLDYAPPAKPKWRLRALIIILIIAAGGAIGAVVADALQPNLYIFSGMLVIPTVGSPSQTTAAKQAHITAIRATIPTAAATLTAAGTPISAREFSNRMTLKDIPQTRLISIQFTGRSFNTPLAMVNALIIPYCNTTPGVTALPGTLGRSTTYAPAGFVLGAAATGLTLALRKRRFP